MRPTSIPVAPDQPDQANYPVDALALFKTFTRDTYLSTFGVQAPAWDPARPPKFWFDSSVDATSFGSVSYTVFRASGARFEPLALAASEAASINLPGALSYAPYVIAPTSANRAGAPITPQWLSLQAEAIHLMTQFGGSGLMDVGAIGTNPVLYPASENRRMWTFTVAGTPLNAGMLLAAQNAAGVGAPGQWNLASPGNPVWISTPAPTGLDDTRPAVALPVRALLPNEKLVPSPFGLGSATVVRMDFGGTSGANQGDGFTAADRNVLAAIFGLVSKSGS